MADLIQHYSTNRLTKYEIGDALESMKTNAEDTRRTFARRWYDNNFFYDGFHFRYMSRTQNKIVDLSERSTMWSPMRAIPKASRQLQGVANLLSSRNFVPVVYPEKISKTQYPDIQSMGGMNQDTGVVQQPSMGQPMMGDPMTGSQLPSQPQVSEYQQAMEEAKRIAKGTGHFLEEEFKKQNLVEKIALMMILAGKHSISYLQVWPDAIEEAIRTQVFDAFDVFLVGSVQEVEDSPYVIKTKPRLISEIKADERFEQEQVLKINPDNRLASSEIKQAYEQARRGGIGGNPDAAATVIEKECFIKEYLDEFNEPRIRAQEYGDAILKGKKKGDPVIRHSFVEGNITVKDCYVNLPGYPIVDFRFEPGPLYQTPLIERFIPSNKSLDLVVSRVERYTHTMVTGSWSRKAGEPAEPSNTAGGQVFDYNTTPPIQNQIAPIPPFVFNFMGLLESFMNEQGVNVSLNQIPSGVKAHAAIESLKEQEFANLSIASERLKGTIKRISEKMLDHVDNYFMKPQTVYYLERGEPQYYDIIGASAIKKREEVGLETPQDVVPIKKDYRVDIEVQSGLAYTREGQKAAAKELGDYLIQLAQLQLVNPEMVKEYFRRLLEIYQFGSGSEIMEAMDEGGVTAQLTEQQLMAIKIAVAEVLKDTGMVGPEADQKLVDSTKVGTAETLKESGIAAKILGDERPNDPKQEAEIAKIAQDMQIAKEEHQLKMAQGEQEMKLKAAEVEQDLQLKKSETAHKQAVTEATTEHDMKMKEENAKVAAAVAKQKASQKVDKKSK